MGVLVREMVPSDFDSVFLMFIKLYDHLNEKGFVLQLNTMHLKELLQLQLDSKLAKIFILEVDGTIAGFINLAAIKINSKFLSTHGKLMGNITELYLSPHYRGQHYGACLTDKATDFFRSLGISLIQVNTMIENTGAIHFYKNQGFQEDYVSFLNRLS